MTDLTRGAELGRYMVLAKLGAGGMGVVLSAYDPELDRRIAIKLVRSELCDVKRSSQAGEQLRREAQAMARFSHPNVVTVYDVGTIGDQLFVAMEYVERDLAAWLAEEERDWQARMAMFLQAGRGLAAAHSSQLVHRDFKPANVLVGSDERPRVSDFGLVTALQASADLGGDVLTATAMGLGTPAYMAPEQFLRLPVGEAADQFAFCVALYEALYVARPFAGSTVDEVCFNVTRGLVREPNTAEAATVPQWVWPVIQRGLAREASERHPSVGSLLAELEHDPAAQHRRLVVIDAMLEFGKARSEVGDYVAAEGALHDALNESTSMGDMQRAAEAQISLAMAEGIGRGVFESALSRLAWVEEVLADGTTATLAGRWHFARGYMAHRQHDLAAACDDYRAALTYYEQAEGSHLLESIEVRASFGEAMRAAGDVDAACKELEQAYALAIAARGTMSRQAASVLDTWAGILQEQGQYTDALARYQEALLMRQTLLGREHPLTADSHVHLGQLLLMMSRYDDATSHLQQGLDIAETALGPENGTTRAALNNLGGVLLKQGDGEAAWEMLQRSLGIAEHIYGPNHPELASTLNNLGQVMLECHQHAAAMDFFKRAFDIRAAALGAEHALTAGALSNIGITHLLMGEAERALAVLEQVRATFERTRGREHPEYANLLINMSSACMQTSPQRLDEAETLLQQARGVIVATFGEAHDSIALIRANLGDVAKIHGRFAEAIDHYQASIALSDNAGRGEHSVIYPIHNMASCLVNSDRHAEAIAPLERASRYLADQPMSELKATVWGSLADALWCGGGDRQRAASLAREARAAFVELGPAGADHIPHVDIWLAERELTAQEVPEAAADPTADATP